MDKIVICQKLSWHFVVKGVPQSSEKSEICNSQIWTLWCPNRNNLRKKKYHWQQYIMKAHVQKWYFVAKIVLTYCEKKMFEWSRKTFESRGWKPRICKSFEITRTICSKSERSEQFLVTECFFNLFLEVSHI